MKKGIVCVCIFILSILLQVFVSFYLLGFLWGYM